MTRFGSGRPEDPLRRKHGAKKEEDEQEEDNTSIRGLGDHIRHA